MDITIRTPRRVCMAALACLLACAAVASPADAATTRTISGTVTCAKGGNVVGIWVSSSAGGSKWASWRPDSVFKNNASFSATISTSASSTSVRLDIGCGGTPSLWASNNSTPSVTVSGSRSVYTDCAEASGSRAVRCSWIPAPPSSSVLTRGKSWVDAGVPYSQSSYYRNQYGSYRQDCSGFVSMAWALSSSYTTGTLPQVSSKIARADMRPGDILLNTSAGGAGHTVLFIKWANSSKTQYVAYEENGAYGRTVQTTLPYSYWQGNGTFLPYRKR